MYESGIFFEKKAPSEHVVINPYDRNQNIVSNYHGLNFPFRLGGMMGILESAITCTDHFEFSMHLGKPMSVLSIRADTITGASSSTKTGDAVYYNLNSPFPTMSASGNTLLGYIINYKNDAFEVLKV